MSINCDYVPEKTYVVGGYKQTIYKGCTIRVVRDDFPPNPFTDWDCEPPILVKYEGSFTEYGLSRSWDIELTREQLMANAQQIKEICGYTLDDLDEEELNAELETWVSYGPTSEFLENLATLYNMAGISAGVKSVCGCVQREYAEVLVVLTPEWVKKVGAVIKDNADEIIEEAAKLYGYWAFGEVYGYLVYDNEDPADNEEPAESVWGFYGDDYEKSGLLYEATSACERLANKSDS